MQTRVYDHIIADPDIFGGKPVIEGTDVPVSALVVGVASGKSLEQVAAMHGVTLDDVRAALEFAAQRADEAVALSDPLFTIAGLFDSGDPGWVDRHDDYLGEAHAQSHGDA